MEIEFPLSSIIGVACSGGADSMCLLALLLEKGAHVVALHVNHGLRAAANLDAQFVADFCAGRGIEFCVFDAPNPPIAPTEVAARNYRYACFNQALQDGTVDYIALAHHREDNAETILLHLFRGSGANGLVGMQAVSGKFLRPLLNYSRQELVDYLTTHGIPNIFDESNADLSFNRNYLRAELFPRLIERYPDCVASILRASATIAEDLRALDSTLAVPPLVHDTVTFPLAIASSAAVQRILYLGAKQLLPSDLERVHVMRILSLFSLEVGTFADVKHGVRAVKEPDCVVLFRPLPAVTTTQRWTMPDVYETVFLKRVFVCPFSDTSIPPHPELVVDADKIPFGSLWRTRRDGDEFTPFGGGRRSLGDFFTDCKIPLRVRDNLTLLCYNQTVLIVVGVEIAQHVRVTKDTRQRVRIGELEWMV